MSKKQYSQLFDSAARERIPDHIDLAPKIMARIQKRRSVLMNPKLKTIMVVLTAVVVFSLALANAPSIVYALQKMLGYIPGLGLVESGDSLRTLAEPVSVTRDGITVTVEKGSVDSNRTTLVINFAGLVYDDYLSQFDRCPLTEASHPQLRLKDGTKLKLSSWMEMHDYGLDVRYFFPALPVGSDDATLEIPCLMIKQSPKDWKIPLHFTPAAGAEALPVIELPHALPTPQVATGSPYGISLVLEKVIPLDDGYIFMGSLNWNDPSPSHQIQFVTMVNNPYVVDGDGDGGIGIEFVSPDRTNMKGSTRNPWAYKVLGKEQVWPLTLKANIAIVLHSTDSFTFDPGPNPQLGQSWPLDQDVMVSGYAIHLFSATLNTNPRGNGVVLDFDVQPDSEDVLGLCLTDVQYIDGNCINRVGSVPGHLTLGAIYSDGLLPGPRKLMFKEITLRVPGDWQVTWQP
jgi:hypothetical protein